MFLCPSLPWNLCCQIQQSVHSPHPCVLSSKWHSWLPFLLDKLSSLGFQDTSLSSGFPPASLAALAQSPFFNPPLSDGVLQDLILEHLFSSLHSLLQSHSFRYHVKADNSYTSLLISRRMYPTAYSTYPLGDLINISNSVYTKWTPPNSIGLLLTAYNNKPRREKSRKQKSFEWHRNFSYTLKKKKKSRGTDIDTLGHIWQSQAPHRCFSNFGMLLLCVSRRDKYSDTSSFF